MAKGDEKKANERREELYGDIGRQRETLQSGPTPLEAEYTPISQQFQNRYNDSADMQAQHYKDILGGYREWREKSLTPTIAAINSRVPKPFTFERVNYERDPSTTGRAVSGYTDFADTGGYSGQDIQELRARGTSPIRAAYGNAMMQLDRNKALQGGYSPNAAAAAESMQRMLPGQIAEATTNVNAELANAIRQGKLAGLGGLTGIGGMETGAKMQAGLANQGAGLRAQELTESALSAHDQRKMQAQEMMGGAIDMERGLYGTTPGQAATFGQQAQEAYRQRLQLEQLRGQLGSNYVDQQLRLLNPIDTGGTPWWKTAIQVAGTAAPYVAMAASARDSKTGLEPISSTNPMYSGLNSISSSIKLKEGVQPITDEEVDEGLKKLPLFKWRYKGDKTTHMGPMAEDFKKIFGVGDGKTLHLADVMGVTLASGRHRASKER